MFIAYYAKDLMLELDDLVLTIEEDSKTFLCVGVREIIERAVRGTKEALTVGKKDQEYAWSSLLSSFLNDMLAVNELKDLATKYNCIIDGKISYIDLGENLLKHDLWYGEIGDEDLMDASCPFSSFPFPFN